MVEQMAPSLLGPFLLPMRGMLKEMLCQAEFPLYRLNEKIEIEMPGMPTLNDQAFALILDAVVKDQELEVGYRDANDEIVQVQGKPKRLKIAPTRWTCGCIPRRGKRSRLNLVPSRGQSS